jgi:hypothetical protein
MHFEITFADFVYERFFLFYVAVESDTQRKIYKNKKQKKKLRGLHPQANYTD